MSTPDEGWEQRMADRAAARRAEREAAEREALGPRIPDCETWPLPPEIRRGASARDALLWYICDGWNRIFGEPPIETLMDHDFGFHVLRKGPWQITLVNTEEFPHHSYGSPEIDELPEGSTYSDSDKQP